MVKCGNQIRKEAFELTERATQGDEAVMKAKRKQELDLVCRYLYASLADDTARPSIIEARPAQSAHVCKDHRSGNYRSRFEREQ
jgi:hypothetical protein